MMASSHHLLPLSSYYHHEPIFQFYPCPYPRPSPRPPKPHLSLQNHPTSSLAPDPTKNSIWVNPNNPRAAALRRRSLDSKYSFLSKLAQSLDSCHPNDQNVHSILSQLGDAPSQQDAVIVLNNMESAQAALLALRYFLRRLRTDRREVVLHNVVLKVLRKNKDWDRIEELLGELIGRGLKPDNVTFSTVISAARRCFLPDKAVEWFERMGEFGCVPDDVTYSAMIDAYGKAGNVDMALDLYDRARKERWRLDLVTFATVIRMYSTSGDFDGALNVFEEMKALGVKPNLVVYNTLLEAMGRAARPWKVKSLYIEMIEKGFSPNWATYAALLRAYGRARYSADALSVYEEMKEKGMELNVILYNTLLAMCADVGCVDEAIGIFEEMQRSENCKADSWSFSSMITIYSCSGQVSDAETMLKKMVEGGYEPNIFVLTSMIQCYGKAKLIGDVVRTFNQLLELGIDPDDRFCGCLLNVMTQTPKEELGMVIGCIERANGDLGSVVKLLTEDEVVDGAIKREATALLTSVSKDVRKAYCNCFIDLCINLNLLDKACELLLLGIDLEIYTNIQSKAPTQWSLHLKSLSPGAALTALHIWMNDLLNAVGSGQELPPVLGIHTGHGKHKYSESGLAGVLESHLRELKAPFHEAPDKAGWFLTTKVAALSWLESRTSPEVVAA